MIKKVSRDFATIFFNKDKIDCLIILINNYNNLK